MKKLFLLTVLTLLAFGAQAQRKKPCGIYGTVCFVDNKLDADFTVFVEETESFADLVVYREDNSLYADASGVWYIVKRPEYAQYRAYMESSKARADFTIYFTDNRSFAGCN